MWVGIKGILGQQAGKTDTGIATLRAQNGKMVSRSKGKRGVLVKHYRKLGMPTANENIRRRIGGGDQRVDRGERRCLRNGRRFTES